MSPPRNASISSRSAVASSATRTASTGSAARALSMSGSGQLLDARQDRLAPAAAALVGRDGLEFRRCETGQAFDDVRRRQLVVIGDRQRGGRGPFGFVFV